MPKLIVTEKGTDKKEVFEFSHEGVTIGRSGDNTVKLPSSAVSRRHANIVVSGGNCFLIDLGSGNGTFLNGTKVPPNEQSILRHGDIVSIEKFNINVNLLDEMLASSFNEITDSDILEVKLLKKVLKAIDKERIPSLEVLNGNFVGKKFFISEDMEEISIGRDEGCDLQIEEYVISRCHAKILKKGGEIVLQDQKSKNGTFINNRRIAEEPLHDGDRIALGTIVLIFRNPQEVKMDELSARTKEAREAKEREFAIRQKPPAEGDDLGQDAREAEPVDFGEVAAADIYPTPAPRRETISLSLFEMGMIGVGILIFVFAVISLVNLLTK